MAAATLGLFAACLIGIGDEVSLQPIRGDRVHAAWQMSLAQINRPSPRTEETLRLFEVADRNRRDPAGALAVLEKAARREPTPELIYAVAELSWIEGRRAEGKRRGGESALAHYIDTVAYAYDFLFDPALAAGRSPSDPRFRIACDLYNGALERLLRAAGTKDGLQPGSTITLTIHGGKAEMHLALYPDTPWRGEDVDELVLANDFEVTGLDSRSRRYGLGVPLIAVRRTPAEAAGAERFYPPEMAFPLTAILRPEQPLRDASNADVDEARRCTIELLDPLRVRSIGRDTGAIPIEADVTTPLAYMWSRTDLGRLRWSGLLRPEATSARAGLMLLRPYEPEKIPVVMVHGLLSSPLAWIPMLNELLRDPEIQRRYQFMLYLYPTGLPVPIAASGLRDALDEARAQFAADGTSPAFDQMVLLGHSMGGLLSHAVAVSSGDAFWDINSDRAFDEILGPADVLAELRHYTFFEARPYVKRVVFLATPHRGSDYSRKFVGRLGSNLIAEPDHYTKLLSELIKQNRDAFPARFKRLPTSIETLDPDSPELLALLRMTPAPDVRFHSIIGSLRPEARANTSDGIVPYRSAHLDGVASEKVVRSDHGVQKDPEAIKEVRRILLEHVGLTAASNPAPASTVEVAPDPAVPTAPAAVSSPTDLPALPALDAARSGAAPAR